MGRALVGMLLVLLAGCAKSKPTAVHGKSAGEWGRALRDNIVQVRREAGAALGHLGSRAKAAIPDLIGALKDPDNKVRAKAAEVLWGLGPASREAVPALIVALRDRDGDVRLNA